MKDEGELKMDLILKYDTKADILSVKISEGEIADEQLLDCDILNEKAKIR